MPKFAVMLRYEIVSGLVIEADDEEAARDLAIEFEDEVNASVEDGDDAEVILRATVVTQADLEEVDDADEGADLLEEWFDELDLDDDEDDDDAEEDDVEVVD